MADPRVQDALDALRGRGERITHARRAVITALAALPDHPTAEQVVSRVEATADGVHRATVYRVLDSLGELGIVSHVHVGHGATSYHLAERSHVHGHCRTCGSVVDLPEGMLVDVRQRLLVEHGFELDAGHIALSGRCATCAARPDPQTS